MEEAHGTEPMRRELADAEEDRAGVDPAGARRGHRAGRSELRRGNGLTLAEPSSALGRERRRREVADGVVGRQDPAPERRDVALLDRRPRHRVLEPE
jgi:hypothetical protein